MYLKLKNGVIDKYPYLLSELRRDNPGVSFPVNIPDETLNEYDVFTVRGTSYPVVDYTQNVTEGQPELVDGSWVQVWVVTPATPEQIAEREAAAKERNAQQAKAYLLDTDWSELPSVVDPANNPHLTNQADFIAYRTALRAIVIDPPVTVESWPVRPESVWETSQS